MKDLIYPTIATLIKTEPFYAELLFKMKIDITDKVPTAGVCIKDNRIQLYINPTFFGGLTEMQKIGLLKHECLHVVFKHFSRAKLTCPELGEKYDNITDAMKAKIKHTTINVAQDLAINEMLPELAGMQGCFVAEAKKKYPEMQHEGTSEYYYTFLKEEQDESLQTIDDHSVWAESSESDEIIDEICKKAVKDANEQSQGRGSMSGALMQAVDKLLYKPRNWKSDLRRFIARTTETYLESTRKRRNRRMGFLFPGDRKLEKLRLAVVIDTSGSINEELAGQFFSEIDALHRHDVSILVIQCDSEVKHIGEWTANYKCEIHGRGGTLYQPALDEANKHEIDGLIYFGDMECFDKELKKPKYPVLWAKTSGAKKPTNWGSETIVEVIKK